MHDLTRTLTARGQWDGTALVRPVTLHGIGGRTDGEALAVTGDGARVGDLLGGTLDEKVTAAALELLGSADVSRLLTLPISDEDAVGAGLSCGGHVDLLVQRASALPATALERMRDGRTVVLATDLRSGRPELLDTAGTGGAGGTGGADDERQAKAARLVRAGRTAAARAGDTVIEVFLPVTRLLVVGSGVLASALAAQARLLGWQASTTDIVDDAVAAVRTLGPTGGVALFAHDPDVDDPVLLAALRHEVGYVGALGSRRTQAARRERLRAAGLTDQQIARVHGPIGLDIGARTPEETALAVCAEALAEVRGRGSAVSLRDTSDPIHR
jgi:xanthine dehydrogenase accessory factor